MLDKNEDSGHKDNDLHPLVSVVLTTKNEEKNIYRCLKSIQSQTYKNIEIIVVDNYSEDQTIKIAKEFTSKIFLKGPERSAQRNYGMIDLAKGIFVIYIDADMILSNILIEACVNKIKSTNAIALYLPEVILGAGYWSRVRNFERSFYNGTVIDGARFFKRNEFVRVGGFDVNLFAQGSGEDWDIDNSIKKEGKIALLENYKKEEIDEIYWPLESYIQDKFINYSKKYQGIYHDESSIDIYRYVEKKLYYSRGFNGYINKWGKSNPIVKKQFGFTYRFFIVFFESGKWMKFIAQPKFIPGLYGLRVLIGFVFLISKLRLKIH